MTRRFRVEFDTGRIQVVDADDPYGYFWRIGGTKYPFIYGALLDYTFEELERKATLHLRVDIPGYARWQIFSPGQWKFRGKWP